MHSSSLYSQPFRINPVLAPVRTQDPLGWHSAGLLNQACNRSGKQRLATDVYFGSVQKPSTSEPQELLNALRAPVAVIDVGTSTTKLLICWPDGHRLEEKFAFELLPVNGQLSDEAVKKLPAILNMLRQTILIKDVPFERAHILATASLRKAQNGANIAENLGIRIIDGIEEARYAYLSVLHNQPISAKKPVMVLEVGGGSTEISLGQGLTGFDPSHSVMIPIGSSLNGTPSEQAFDAETLQTFRENFSKTLTANKKALAPGKKPVVYIKPSRSFEIAEATIGSNGQDTPIMRAQIENALTPQALKHLQALVKTHSAEAAFLRRLPKTLAILAEIMNQYDLTELRVGSSGGVKQGVVLHQALTDIAQTDSQKPV